MDSSAAWTQTAWTCVCRFERNTQLLHVSHDGSCLELTSRSSYCFKGPVRHILKGMLLLTTTKVSIFYFLLLWFMLFCTLVGASYPPRLLRRTASMLLFWRVNHLTSCIFLTLLSNLIAMKLSKKRHVWIIQRIRLWQTTLNVVPETEQKGEKGKMGTDLRWTTLNWTSCYKLDHLNRTHTLHHTGLSRPKSSFLLLVKIMHCKLHFPFAMLCRTFPMNWGNEHQEQEELDMNVVLSVF